MEKKSVLRNTSSKTLIIEAYLTLLKKKTATEISISEICQTAQVARKTFYNNFESKEDIIVCAIKSFLTNWKIFDEFHIRPIESMYRVIFVFVKEHKDIFLLIYECGYYLLAERELSDFCLRRWDITETGIPFSAALSKYYIAGTISLFLGILKTWIYNDCDTPIDDLVQLTDAMILRSGKDKQ